MILTIILVIISVLLISVILIQSQGSGLGSAFGGGGNVYRSKRGIEKKLHNLTVSLAILFFGIALANILF